MTVSLGQSSTPPNTRIYAVGDVHGHIKLLDLLHRKITTDLKNNPIDGYKIIYIGDYIDRGPDSAGCVEYLINLLATDSNVVCLKGNHEDKLERFLSDPVRVADSFFTWGGEECASSYGVDMSGYRGTHDQKLQKAAELSEKIPLNHKHFFARLQKKITFGDYMFAHAGIRPGVSLDQQSDRDLLWIRSDFISHSEPFEKVIVHGHTPAYPLEVLPNRINVDTHAYHTGVLSCIVLQGTDYRIMEVNARA